MEIYAVDVSNRLDRKYFQHLFECLSSQKQYKIQSFYHDDDKEKTLIGEILIRYMISHYLNLKPNRIILKYNTYGKPYIEGNLAFFNLSHSGKWVVAVIDHKENGIDVQEIGKVDMNVAKNFFLQREYLELIQLEGEARANLFYELWTLKESYIKTVGKGLSIPLNSFTFKKSTENQYQSFTGKKTIFFQTYNIDTQYKMALGSYSTQLAQDVTILTSQHLYRLFVNSL
ncbi:4'-phosphopantetheinyl transferase superfamily protein [Bacillus thuringiensis]|nr:4'-phosphopantetheinyl transferase superfamily protein [Bacillus thuringiensis]